MQEHFSLRSSHCWFFFIACAFDVISKKIIAKTTVKEDFFPMFSYRSFIASGVTSKSLIHFELSFCEWCKIGVQFHFFACEYPFFPAFVEETVLSSLSFLCPLVKYYLTIYAWVYFWALDILFHWSIWFFMPVPYCFDFCRFGIYFEIRKCDAPALFFFLKIILALGVFCGSI